MLKVSIRSIRRGKEGRLRSWLSELQLRRQEVLETFSQEGVRAEQAFIHRCGERSLLVYVSEAEDLEEAAKAFRASSNPIDIEHRAVMNECLEASPRVEPLYDVHVTET